MSQRYTFLLKLPKISGIFFQKEGKEDGYRGISHADFADYADLDLYGLEFRKSSSLIFLFPTDFTDTHRLLTYSVLGLKHNSGRKILPDRRSSRFQSDGAPDG